MCYPTMGPAVPSVTHTQACKLPCPATLMVFHRQMQLSHDASFACTLHIFWQACCVCTICCCTYHWIVLMCVAAYALQISLDSLVLWALDQPHTPYPPSSGYLSRSPRSPIGISGHHGLASLLASSSPFLGPLEACVASLFLLKATVSTPNQSADGVQILISASHCHPATGMMKLEKQLYYEPFLPAYLFNTTVRQLLACLSFAYSTPTAF